MQVMRSVAEAAGFTTADLMCAGRRSGLCNARAAVYKIASRNGYSRDEIMFFLDRNRTVSYNYEANINGYLLTCSSFKKLCDKANEILNKHPHRVSGDRRPEEEQADKPAEQIASLNEPVFTEWKGQLGWTLSAEDCRREWFAVRDAIEFMKTFCKPSPIKHSQRRIAPVVKVASEMTTAEAAFYLGIPPGILVKGVKMGRLRRFKKPTGMSYWFYTAELDQYKIYLKEKRRNNHEH